VQGVPAREGERGQMSSETLSLKEERLGKAIDIIRAGCNAYQFDDEYHDLIEGLREWCLEEENYLLESFSMEFWPRGARE